MNCPVKPLPLLHWPSLAFMGGAVTVMFGAVLAIEYLISKNERSR